jgi:hypothetical protein
MKLTLYVDLLWAVWHLPDHFAEEGWGVEALISAPIIFAVEFVSLFFARASCCQRLCGSPRSPTDGPACGRCLPGCFVGGSALAGGWWCCLACR